MTTNEENTKRAPWQSCIQYSYEKKILRKQQKMSLNVLRHSCQLNKWHFSPKKTEKKISLYENLKLNVHQWNTPSDHNQPSTSLRYSAAPLTLHKGRQRRKKKKNTLPRLTLISYSFSSRPNQQQVQQAIIKAPVTDPHHRDVSESEWESHAR